MIAQQRLGHLVAIVVQFQQHRPAASPSLDGGAEIAHEVFGFFFDLDVAVAQDAKDAVAQHLETGEKLVGKTRHQLFDAHVDRFIARDTNEARCAAGDQHHLDQIGLPLPALKTEDHPDAPVRHEGKRVAGIDRLRGDQWEDVAFEIARQPILAVFRQIVDRCQQDAFLRKQIAQGFQTCLLAIFQREQLFADRGKLLARARPVYA